MSSCPSLETLARLGHDTLAGAEWTAVEAHLQECEQCVGLLEQLVACDKSAATVSASASLPAENNLPRIPGFEIEAEVERGGMGVVYRAWERELARTVALKIMASGPMNGARTQALAFRSAMRYPGSPPERRQVLRRGRGRRLALPGAGIRAGREPEGAAAGTGAATRRRRAHETGRRGDDRGAHSRSAAPRSETLEHPPRLRA